MLELIEQYWPVVVGIIGVIYGYVQRVSKKEFIDFMADVESVTEDGDITPEETINIIAKLIRIFKE